MVRNGENHFLLQITLAYHENGIKTECLLPKEFTTKESRGQVLFLALRLMNIIKNHIIFKMANGLIKGKTPLMKTVCSKNMPYVEEAFSTLGDVTVLEGRSIVAADVQDADLLATRSTTKVDAALLDGSSVRFVGTATIGIDHLDVDYLERNDIHWCFSPGCNANSVSEYITTALLCSASPTAMDFLLKAKLWALSVLAMLEAKLLKKRKHLA